MFGEGLLIAALFLVPGYAVWLAFGQGLRGKKAVIGAEMELKQITAVEILFLMMLSGLVVVLWVGALLAELGVFSLPLLGGVMLLGSLAAGGWAIRNGRSPNSFQGARFQPVSLLVLPILAIAIWLSPRPFEYINGGRDHGLYINTGIHIARTGSILIQDEELAAVPAPSRPLLVNPEVTSAIKLVPGPWSEGQRLPGMTIRSLDQGIIAPHAFHLYPVMIAVFAAAGGVDMALMTTIVIGLLGAFSVYVASARLLGQPVGLLAFLLLTISLAQVWYTKTPSAEILLQPLFWGGLFAFSLMLETQNRYTAVLAGLSFGLMHLAKLDTVFVPLVLFLFFLYRWFKRRFQAADWVFIAVYGAVALHAALHAFFIATIYFLDQATRVLLPDFLAQIVIKAAAGHTSPAIILQRLVSQNGAFVAVGLVVIGLLLWAARRFQPIIGRQLARAEGNARRGQGALALALGLSVMGVYLAQSFAPLEQFANPWQFLTFASWYLTPTGLLLGVVGLVQVGTRHNKSLVFAWLMLVGHIMPLFIMGAGTFPDQFWAIRRFVPVVLPAFILFAANALWNLAPKSRQNWPQALLPLGLVGAFVLGQGQNLRPFLHFTDYAGMTTQVTQLAESFPENAVLLFEKSDAANRVTAPLWFIFDRTVFLLEEGAITNPALNPAIEQWQKDGRAVFWLGNGSESPDIQGAIVADYEDERIFAVPLAEGPAERLPQNTGLFLGAFDAHRIRAADLGDHRSVSTIAIGRDANGAAAVGLYPPSQSPGLTPRRWTSGQAAIEFPVPNQLTQIYLQMGNGRPPSVPAAEVAIYLNDMHLETVAVASSNAVYNLTIPLEWEADGETAVLRLEMTPWVPAQTGYSADQRELGVYLDWIKLITTTAND